MTVNSWPVSMQEGTLLVLTAGIATLCVIHSALFEDPMLCPECSSMHTMQRGSRTRWAFGAMSPKHHQLLRLPQYDDKVVSLSDHLLKIPTQAIAVTTAKNSGRRREGGERVRERKKNWGTIPLMTIS